MTFSDRPHDRAGTPGSSPAGTRPASDLPGQRSGEGATSVLPALHDDAGRRPDLLPGAPSQARGPAGNSRGRSGGLRTGRHLVSPLVKLLENGWFATSVSIRSGCGSATTDSVLRLTRLFRCADEATAYARSEALQWIAATRRPLYAA